MKAIHGLVVLFLLCCIGSLLAQQTIHVPADQPTIQGGIDAANNGDTVLVATGVYTENIDFKGKSIVVTSGATSFAGASNTILRPAHEGPIVTFQNGEPPATVLNGFTVENGFVPNLIDPAGDGIDILGASPTITNNIITLNEGCGIFALSPQTLTIQNNSIGNNIPESPGTSTGYPHCGKAHDEFDNNSGEGIYVRGGGYVQIIGNTIQNDTNGEIIINAISKILIENNWIEGGTGISISRSAPPGELDAIQNVFYVLTPDNGGSDEAGVGFGTIDNSTQEFGNFIGVNNTFFNGSIGFDDSPASAKVANNVFSLDSAQFTTGHYPVNYELLSCPSYQGLFEFSKLIANNNDLYPDGLNSLRTNCPLSTGNLDADPQFLSTDPSAFDFHTQRTSPVVAAGDINAPMIPATDFAGKNRTVCGTIDMGAYEVHPQPPITVSSSPNPSVGGTTVTFAIHVQGNCNIPTGTLTILDGQTPIGTVALDATGNATFSTAALFVGTHPITATYPGDFNFDPSASNIDNQVVTGYPTTTSLQVVPNPAQAFESITFTANLTSSIGVPTGTVSFLSGTQILTTVSLNGAGVAVATLNTLGVGTYQITAVYNASVDYQGSTSAPVSLVVNGATTTTSLSSAPNPSSFGQLVTFTAVVSASQSAAAPTGTVSFREGATILGSTGLTSSGVATLNLSTLNVGSHTIVAAYGGSGNNSVSTSTSIVQIVSPAQATVSLTGTPNPAALGQTVTLLATISTANGLPTSGTVTFSDQFGTIGSAPVSAGQATLQASTLTSGTHNIIASFGGSGGFGGANSPALLEVIQSFDFSISLSPATLSLASGSSGHVTVQVTGVGNLPGNVALSAAQVPDYGSVSFAPTAVQFAAAGTGSSVLSIDTAQLPQHAFLENPTHRRSEASAVLLAGFAALPLILMGRRKRYRLKLPALLCALFTAVVLTTLSGCTNIYYPLNRIAPGTYSIPITGVDQVSGLTHSTALTLTVTP